MRVLALVVLCVPPFLLTAWTTRDASPAPPQCSAGDIRRNATLLSPSRQAPIYIRYCGRARVLLRVGTNGYAISGGHCLRGTDLPGARGLGGIAIGLLASQPKAPGRGVAFGWGPPFTSVGKVRIDDSEIELGGCVSLLQEPSSSERA
jgi:hypothetical protein